MKRISIILFSSVLLWSCHDDNTFSETENNSARSSAREGFKLSNIDNGLDGQILIFDSADAYSTLQLQLESEANSYSAGFQSKIPKDIDQDSIETYFNQINFNEDFIYQNFEETIGFNSFRLELNKQDEVWLENQFDKSKINEIGDPDNNTLILESDRTLYNTGGEVIVLDSLQNPIIYKAFDWGHLIIENFDTAILKEINLSRLKNLEEIKTKFGGQSNVKFQPDLVYYPSLPCKSDNINKKQHVYSPNGRNNVKSIIKKRVAPFERDTKSRLVIKSKAYQWKKNKWKHTPLWMDIGFTSSNSQANLPVSFFHYNCSGTPFTMTYLVNSFCGYKFTYNGGPYGPIAITDNSVYAYHGEGQFRFTVDFYGYETNTISY